MAPVESKKVLQFLELVGRLKHMKRTGWVHWKVDECETIAGHMYRMAMMTFLLTDENNTTNLNIFKCLQMALVHDLAECIMGDITPHCGVSGPTKQLLEDDAMNRIVQLTGLAGSAIYELYKEYEQKRSPEAVFVKELDCYDVILQAFEYEKRERVPRKFQEFFTAHHNKFKHPLLKDLVKELYRQRAEFEYPS